MARTMRCPICKRPVSMDDPNMPFCSDRCRAVDLGNWASEVYAIPASPSSSPLDDEDEGEELTPRRAQQ